MSHWKRLDQTLPSALVLAKLLSSANLKARVDSELGLRCVRDL